MSRITTTFFRVLLAIVVCCSTAAVWAQSEVHVEKAGTLSTLLTTNGSSLKVTGSINGTDVKYLRQLINSKGLTSLDLSEVKIVSGGDAYFDDLTTEKDVMGESMFESCSKLQSILLPTTVNVIGSKAFTGTGLKEVEIPNSVSTLGFDAFAYCNSLAKVVIGNKVKNLNQGVFYSSPVKNVYMKPLTPPNTPPYLFSSSPKIYVYTDVLSDYKQANWGQYGTVVGKLEDYYELEKDSVTIARELSATFFDDAACTELKAAYKAMGDDELKAAFAQGGMPSFMTDIALKVKNEQWAAYEKDFRIHSYGAYSDASYWNTRLKSSGGSYMGNPTGIFAKEFEPLYVFVNDDVPSDATLYIAGCTDNNLITNAKTGQKLVKGLNVIEGQKDALYYILYTADTQPLTKILSDWPAMKIHIEGGTVNGYYDVSRHSDTDYKAILRAAKHERFTVRGEHTLFNFKTSTYKSVWPQTIDKSISWFDSLAVWQRELMGYATSVAQGRRAMPPYNLTGGEALFPEYYNNPNFAIEGEEADAGWANSTPYRTSYNSVACIRSSFDVTNYDVDDWCAGHECGHNNQGAINLEGGTEVSNNLFANVVRFLDGLVTSTGSPISDTMDEYVRHLPYPIRTVDTMLRMYYQLYLYYHQAQHNTSFYPELFKALREDPLTLWRSNTNNSSLKFVRKVCEVAQEDLTEYFTVWGFFEPCRNLHVEDYGSHTMSILQNDINRTLDEISQYPVKNTQILLIEDRADYVPTTDFLTTAGNHRRGSEVVGQYATLGQYTDFMEGAGKPSSYTYRQADSLFAMEGTGGVGFMVRDSNDKLLYAANTHNFCIPTAVGTDFTIYSVDADGTQHETLKQGSGIETVNLETAGTLADSLSQTVIKAIIGGVVNGTDFKYMRQLVTEGNLASIDLSSARVISGGSAYYQNYHSALNTLGNHLFSGCSQLISIRLPERATKINDNAFSRSGLREIVIPDNVNSVGGDAFAYCKQLRSVVVGSKVKNMSQGVFYSSGVKDAYVKPLTPPSVSLYLFSSNPVIHVYAKALDAYKKSKWAEFGTIVGDLDDYEDITSVQPIDEVMPVDDVDAPVYDLFGRRAINLEPGVIYIRNGRKFVNKR
ncbi:MAG: leucine-rich repeat protein [Bacteroidaceae bacterium]|nr:leucine-rich repeat protein [Bacteroidaceae bacterium]